MTKSAQEFKEKLETTYSFPTLYMFKFIVPNAKVGEIESLFPKNEMGMKASSNGKYVSVTIKMMASSSDQIIDIYTRAGKIEGIISL